MTNARDTAHSPYARGKGALQKQAAAAWLDVSVDTFERHVAPDLACVYIGKVRLYSVAELERWLRENACAPARVL